MPSRKFKLIYLSHDLSRKIELSLSRAKVKAALVGLVFCFLLTNVVAGFLASRLINSRENQSLVTENSRLRDQLELLDSRLSSVNERLAGLAVQDNQLRLLAGLPDVDADVREAGVGGGLGDPAVDPNYPELTRNTWTLEKIEREIEIQQVSFEEIHSKLTANAELLEHTPSLRPLDGGYVSSGFGVRRDPYTRRMVQHSGVDLPQLTGTPVVTTAEGQVIFAGRYFNYGKFIVIDHGFGYQTAYGHLARLDVREGQYVSKGQQVGAVGCTGRSTAPHLHYEVRVNGVPVDPLDYFFDEVASFPGQLTHQ